MEDPARPILRVKTTNEDFREPESGGGARKLFETVTNDLRHQLAGQARHIAQYFSASFSRWPEVPAVAHVKIKKEAWAKSHRPIALFNSNTCPVIGVADLGELLVSVTPEGIGRLEERLLTDKTKIGEANISTLFELTPHTSNETISGADVGSWLTIEKDVVRPLRVQLFRHRVKGRDLNIMHAFKELLTERGLKDTVELGHSRGQGFRVDNASLDAAKELARFVGAQTVELMPQYGLIRTQANPIGNVPDGAFPGPDPQVEYPVVGIVDSGTDLRSALLSPWRTAQEAYVASSEQNLVHGSFVSGLAVNARRLNYDDGRFPDGNALFVDCVALGKNGISEDELVTVLKDVLEKFPDVRIWNLSLGGETVCSDGAFSSLATELDDLQDAYDVLFILAAGNLSSGPFRDWPATVHLGETDRICAPADSVRALTVGSVASNTNNAALVGIGDPSPFSRRGPGPAFLPKPEVVHFGGNCDPSGVYAQLGILSVNDHGSLAEGIGTSYAAPLVASVAAAAESYVEPLAISWRNVVKGLIVHSAALNNGSQTAHELHYRGFGIPASSDGILNCMESSATILVEAALVTGVEFERWPFALPKSLIDEKGRFHGEIIVTLVYDPPLDISYGPEYCRMNVEVSLGTYTEGKNGKREHKKKLPEQPADVRKLYEHEQIKHGFKWSPVKVYRRLFKGVSGDCWRLSVRTQARSEYHSGAPQNFVVLVTVRDPEGTQPIYQEMIEAMKQLEWETEELRVAPGVRIRT